MTDYENYEQQLPLIFKDLRKKREYEKGLREDGLYNPKVYFSESRLRILQVYKEIHGRENDDWCPVRFDKRDDESMGMIEGNSISNATCPTWRCMLGLKENSLIQGIGYINLRKTPGGSRTNKEELFRWFKNDIEDDCDSLAELLFKQIQICNADVIVFGGTFNTIWRILEEGMIEGGKSPKTWLTKIDYSRCNPALMLFQEEYLSFWEPNGSKVFGNRHPFIVQIHHPSQPLNLYPFINYAYHLLKDGM